MENSRTFEVCNVDVHKTSMQKHLRSKGHLKNEKEIGMIIPEWFFKKEQAHNKKNLKKCTILKP